MKESELQAAARQFSMAVIAREVLADAIRILRAEDVEVMPLKGVLLHALVYADVMDRPLKDVDLAVRSVDFGRARDALARAGYSLMHEEGGMYEVVLRSERFPLCIDLHRAFAAARRFRLTPDAMFRRGRRDETLLGCPVVLPDDHDLYAHLLAHAVLDFVGGLGWHRPQDLALVARSRALDPDVCARRLEEHGLARFTRLALAPETPLGVDPFAAQVLARLAPDPLGGTIARIGRSLYGTPRSPPLARRALAVLLNPSLAEAGLAVVEAMMERSRRLISPVRH